MCEMSSSSIDLTEKIAGIPFDSSAIYFRGTILTSVSVRDDVVEDLVVRATHGEPDALRAPVANVAADLRICRGTRSHISSIADYPLQIAAQ